MPFYREPYNYKKFPLQLFLKSLEKALLASEEEMVIYLGLRMYEFSYSRGYEVINTKKAGKKWRGVVIKEKLLDFLYSFAFKHINIAGLGVFPYLNKYLPCLRDNNPEEFLERVEKLISLLRFLSFQYKFPLSYWRYKYKKKKENKDKFLLILTTFAEREFEYRFKALSYLGEFAWEILMENIEEEFIQALYEKREEEEALLLSTLALLLPSRVNYFCEFYKEEFSKEEVYKRIEQVFQEREIDLPHRGIKKIWSF